MLPCVDDLGLAFVSSRGLPNNNNKINVVNFTATTDAEFGRPNCYKRTHERHTLFTPLLSKEKFTQRCLRDYFKETGILSRRGGVMAPKRKTSSPLWRHDYAADTPSLVLFAVVFLATSYLKMATSMIEVNRVNSFLSCPPFEGCTCSSVFSQKVQIPTGYGMEAWATVTFGYCSIYEACRCAWRIAMHDQPHISKNCFAWPLYSVFSELNADLQTVVGEFFVLVKSWAPLLFWTSTLKTTHGQAVYFPGCCRCPLSDSSY